MVKILYNIFSSFPNGIWEHTCQTNSVGPKPKQSLGTRKVILSSPAPVEFIPLNIPTPAANVALLVPYPAELEWFWGQSLRPAGGRGWGVGVIQRSGRITEIIS